MAFKYRREWRTRICEFSRAKVSKLGLRARVHFLGEVSGDAKENLFANSDVVVVPSYVENFGIVVAEALARELPVIAGNRHPLGRGCGRTVVVCGWITIPRALVAALRQIREMPLGEMGRRGRAWMEKEFSWQSVSTQMLAIFRDCVDRSGEYKLLIVKLVVLH